MASSGNFSTMNPLNRTSGSVVYTNGNLSFSPGSSWSSTTFTRNNMYIPKDKKIYFELYHKTQNGYYAGYGFGAENAPVTSSEFGATGCITTYYGNTRVNGTQTSSQFTSPSEGDIIQFAIDGSNNKVWFGINNTWVLSGDPANGSNEIGTITTNSTVGYDIGFIAQQNAVSTLTMNFGQDSTFAGDVTAGGNADANGFGDFKYAPPTGFLALCSGNLSVSDDIDPAQTDTDYSSKQFNTVLFDGNGTTNAVTGLGFQPDLIIGFTRSGAQSKRVVDSTRGGSERLYTDLSDAASTGTATISSFDSDGFTATGGAFNNDSGKTCGAWCWKATGGTTASNGSGSITTTVQANTKAGFSIITYTGNGSNSTIGHGLTKAPELIWVKRRSGSAQNWRVYHASLGATQRLTLNDNRAAETASTFQDTTPSNTVIYIGNDSNINTSGADQLAYAWHGVEGYSKFGSYEGNADNDGPFVYTGFRPRMLWIKEADNADDWVVYDTARDTANTGSSKVTRFESSVVEFDGSSRAIDILSNGFKIRTSNNTINQSSTFVWGCWGDVPFKYNNTF